MSVIICKCSEILFFIATFLIESLITVASGLKKLLLISGKKSNANHATFSLMTDGKVLYLFNESVISIFAENFFRRRRILPIPLSPK